MATQTESQNADKIKEEVREVIRRLTELSQSQEDFDKFCAEVLDRLVDITGAHGALFWQMTGQGVPKLTHHAGSAPHDQARAILSPENERHGQAILDVVRQKSPVGLASQSFTEGAKDADGNPVSTSDSPFLMLFSPVLNRQKDAVGAVELVQRGDISPQAQEGYLRFLTQIAALFQRWHERQEVAEAPKQAGNWNEKMEFVSEVHRSIDFKETAYAVANEARRVLGADRVSVGRWNGKNCKILSISSQDRFDNRANVVRKLGNVATASVGADSTFWVTGNTDEIAPEVAKKINDYLDESHSRTLAVIPLAIRPPDVPDLNMTKKDHKVRKLGALILEYFDDEVAQDTIRDDCDLIVEQSQLALENARKHNEIFLQPILKKLGWLQQTLFGDHLKKTITGLTALGIITLAMIFLPWEMKMKVDGVLHPETRRHVYSVSKGIIETVEFEDNQKVTEGQPLLQMVDYDRQQQLKARYTERESLGRQFAELYNQIMSAQRSGNAERASVLTGERQAVGRQLQSVEKLIRNDEKLMKEMMDITSPIDGTIITWNPQQRLKGLVVEPNQTLVSIYKMDGMWQLEVNIPQIKVGYVTRAMHRVQNDDDPNNDDIIAEFAMSTNPNKTYRGVLERVSIRPHTDDSGIQKFRGIIKVDPKELEVSELKPGAGATVKIFCGKEPLYRVCFHQVIDWCKINLWLF
jgi:multidrug resistance efflux pump